MARDRAAQNRKGTSANPKKPEEISAFYSFFMQWLPVLVGGALLLAWLGRGLFFLVYDRGLPALRLNMADAQLTALTPLEDADSGTYRSEDIDPQIVFEGLDIPARTLVLQIEFERPPGEMALYYTRAIDEDFSPQRRVFGRLAEDGRYVYTLPAGHIASLRLDPGEQSMNKTTIGEILLNPPQPAGPYFLPTARGLVDYVLWSALASCGIYTIMEWAAAIRRRHGKLRKPDEAQEV